MNSIILTDYKSIGRILDMCDIFQNRINDKLAYIIVDNSAEEYDKKYLEDIPLITTGSAISL